MAALASHHQHHHFAVSSSRQTVGLESTDGSMDSNDVSGNFADSGTNNVPDNVDNVSCCSDDTVLSVGNENPVTQQPTENLSFKNIESHLNAISKITNSTLAAEGALGSVPHCSSSSSHSSSNPTSPLSQRLSPSLSVSTKSPQSFAFSFHQNSPQWTTQQQPPPQHKMDTSPNHFNSLQPHHMFPSSKCTPSSSSPNSPESLSNNRSPKPSSSPDNNTSAALANLYFRTSQVQVSSCKSASGCGSGGVTAAANDATTTNNASLKFSIDNILKADFGRRITDPINIKTKSKTSLSAKGAAGAKVKDINVAATAKAAGVVTPLPVDLSKSDVGVASDKSGATTAAGTTSTESTGSQPILWPAWVYCTRYSDRPSSGPRSRRVKKPGTPTGAGTCKGAAATAEEKRPRTAFSGAQLARLKHEFAENRYLTERRRQQLSGELGLNEAQIKIWFQNKRAKIKKASGHKNPLALQLMAQGLYNHSTVPLTREEEELQELQSKAAAASGGSNSNCSS